VVCCKTTHPSALLADLKTAFFWLRGTTLNASLNQSCRSWMRSRLGSKVQAQKSVVRGISSMCVTHVFLFKTSVFG
jgi:hypothetical protein